MKYLLTILTVVITSCQPIGKVPTHHIDPLLHKFVEDFVTECENRHIQTPAVDLTVVFVPSFPDHQIGNCHQDGTDHTVTISRAWFDAHPDGREQLLYHELGHCLLNRSHEDLFIIEEDAVIYASIMATIHINDGDYAAHHQHYLNELFR